MKRYIWLLLPIAVLIFAAGFRTTGYRSDNTIVGNYTFTGAIDVDSTNTDHLIANINMKLAGAADTVSMDTTQFYISRNKSTVDTAIYLKWYGAQTGDYGIVIDMDTSLNTAANVRGIDMSGGNAFDGSNDYFLYLNTTNYWSGSGSVGAVNIIGGGLYSSNHNSATASGGWTANIYNNGDYSLNWSATKKGDIIFKDGNLATGTVNLNFIQVQDSAGTANLNIPNKGIRGHLHFAGNCLVDTVPGVTGVTDNSFVFLTWKGTAAPTSPLAWKYLGVDSIAVYCAIADSTAGRVSGYTWFRIE